MITLNTTRCWLIGTKIEILIIKKECGRNPKKKFLMKENLLEKQKMNFNLIKMIKNWWKKIDSMNKFNE